MSHSYKYKSGYIHLSYFDNVERVRVSVHGTAYAMEVRSVHAAKIAITKHLKASKNDTSSG